MQALLVLFLGVLVGWMTISSLLCVYWTYHLDAMMFS